MKEILNNTRLRITLDRIFIRVVVLLVLVLTFLILILIIHFVCFMLKFVACRLAKRFFLVRKHSFYLLTKQCDIMQELTYSYSSLLITCLNAIRIDLLFLLTQYKTRKTSLDQKFDWSEVYCYYYRVKSQHGRIKKLVLFSCTGSEEQIQKTQQCSTAKQRFVKKGVQWLFPLCTGTPGHNQNIPSWTTVKLFPLKVSRSLPWEKHLILMKETLNNTCVNLILQAWLHLFERNSNASLVSFNTTQNSKFSKKP